MWFQSLLGFKINWNGNSGTVAPFDGLFQSLLGFKINWNFFELQRQIYAGIVSIPIRV